MLKSLMVGDDLQSTFVVSGILPSTDLRIGKVNPLKKLLVKFLTANFLLLSSRMSLLWVAMGEGLRPLSPVGW